MPGAFIRSFMVSQKTKTRQVAVYVRWFAEKLDWLRFLDCPTRPTYVSSNQCPNGIHSAVLSQYRMNRLTVFATLYNIPINAGRLLDVYSTVPACSRPSRMWSGSANCLVWLAATTASHEMSVSGLHRTATSWCTDRHPLVWWCNAMKISSSPLPLHIPVEL